MAPLLAVIFGLVCPPIILLASHDAIAQTSPMITGNVVRDYARITFAWPEKVYFTAYTQGNKLVIRFDRPIKPDFGSLLMGLYPYITKADLTDNQTTVMITMNNPYRIRTFISGNETGVDLLQINQASQQASAAVIPPPAPPAPTAATTTASPAATPATAPKPVAAAPAAPALKTAAVAPPAPTPVAPATPKPKPVAPAATTVAVVPPAQVTAAAPTPAPAPVPAVKETSTPKKTETLKEEAREATTKTSPSAATVVALETASAPTKLRQDVRAIIKGTLMPLETTQVEHMPTLRFPWKESVGATVYNRGQITWVLFDKPTQITRIPETVRSNSSWIRSIDQLGGPHYTLLRIMTHQELAPQVSKPESSYAWAVSFVPTAAKPSHPIEAQTTESNGEKSLFLPVTGAGEPLTLQDPDIGDTLTLIPVSGVSTAISNGRSYIDVDLLQTAQGIAISQKTDGLTIQHAEDGIRIHAPGGLYLSHDLPDAETATPAQETAEDEPSDPSLKPTLFRYDRWKPEEGESFADAEKRLLGMITAPSTTPLAQNKAREELAGLYISEGMATEALGVLYRLRSADLDYFRARKLSALEMAAYFLDYHIPEALRSMASDTLTEEPEMALWSHALTTMLAVTPPENAVPFLENYEPYIRQYPPILQQRLAIVAADDATERDDYDTPLAIFDRLEKEGQLAPIADYATFLRGKIAAHHGRADEARKLWQSLTEKTEDRQFRARAEYALVLLDLENNAITPEDAIHKLEKLRIVWRGDDLERSILTLIGQLYVNHGEYWDGLKAWEELLQYYPNTQEAIASYQRMAETFRYLFLEDGAKDLRPLKALALYNEFQELTPLGPEGDLMIRHLVDRLVAVDLLDQAAARLENQLQFRLQGEEKSMIGARLAMIYLLNREPTKALLTLKDSREDNVPAELSLQRNRIAAQALLHLKKPEQALVMIDGDYEHDADGLRLEAFWQLEDWANVVDIIEFHLNERPDMNAAFTPEEGQQVMRLALAYLFMGEYNQLAYLRQAYLPLLKGNPYEEQFGFLAQERTPINHKDFQQVVETIAGMENFMDHFRKQLLEGSLFSDALSEPKPDTAATKPAEDKTGDTDVVPAPETANTAEPSTAPAAEPAAPAATEEPATN